MAVLNPQFVQELSDRYRLDREVGAGGMATVYLAHDIRHDRQVAVKILRPELAAIIGGERFLHEIRTTANLQHPHILPLHDSGEVAGSVFYVMPFVEGQSLRDRLNQERQLPVDEAVRITREVASALDYAHRHGVVHRDIKPENILLHDGQALVADFGIALAVSRSDGGTRMTETGMSLGTPHYMAPEQAMGEREISARADVYALGCVLYECLVGEPPFTGPTAQAIIARVMTDSPRALQTQRRTIPSHVEAAVRTALEKLPADRFASAAAFSEALGNSSYGAGAAALAATGRVGSAGTWDPRSWSAPMRAVTAGALVLAVTTAWLALRPGGATGAAPARVAFTLLDSVPANVHAVASDAGTIAWIGTGGLYVRRAGETDAALMPGTADAVPDVLDFSPDGEWVVYAALPTARTPQTKGAIRKIALSGGGPQPVTNELPGAGFEIPVSMLWGDDGRIYFDIVNLVARSGIILSVDAEGGPLDTIATLPGLYAVTRELLPGDRTLLVTVASPTGTNSRILALDKATGDTTQIALAVTPTWSPTGHLLFVRADGTMQALPFDPRRLRQLGPPITVADSVAVSPWVAFYHLSSNGTLVYTRGPSAGGGGGGNRIVFVRLDGTVERVPLPATDHPDGAVSPDGRRLAYTRDDAVWIYDLDLGTHRQLTQGGSGYHNPVWSPDGTRVLYRASRDTVVAGAMFIQWVDSAAAVRRIGGTSVADNPGQWLADGTILSYTDLPAADIHRTVAEGEPRFTPVLSADWPERAPRVSPDGKWIAFQSGEGNIMRITVRRWPDLRDKVVVSEGAPRNNAHPLWSPDSRTLYYQEGSRVIAATLAPGPTFRVASRREISDQVTGPLTAVHPDGRLFGFVLDAGEVNTGPVRRRVIVVTNWDQPLRTRQASAP
ncbi:MAG: protein kinase [Gemmatimonadaceae bacterium]